MCVCTYVCIYMCVCVNFVVPRPIMGPEYKASVCGVWYVCVCVYDVFVCGVCDVCIR